MTEMQSCPTQLNAAQLEQFARDGFLAFTNVMSAEEIEAAKSGLSEIVQTMRHGAQQHANSYGITWRDTERNLTIQFEANLTIQFENAQAPDGADDPDLELKVRKYHDIAHFNEFFKNLIEHQPKIRGVMNGLIGENALSMQNMALVKPPFFGSEKPWHQDDAYFAVAPPSAVCGVWIALDEAGIDNGCMVVLPGWHARGALKHHHASSPTHATDCTILPDRLNFSQAIPVPLSPGGALFFSGLLPHQTPFNTSPQRRRALQFHYRAADSEIVDFTTYSKLFVEADGTPASCAAALKTGL